MAKTLSKSGILTGADILAGHVTQSVDAFTGIEAYNIRISGSTTISGSLNITPTQASSGVNVLTVDGTGKVFKTGSYSAGGGGTTPNLQEVTDQGNSTTNDVKISGSLYQTGSLAYFQPDEFAVDALGDTVLSVGQGGTQNVKLGANTTSTEVKGPLTASIISASGNLFASASDDSTIGHVALYNTSSGQFFYTASSAISVTPPTLQQVTDQGSSTTTAITASIISASSTVFISSSLLDPAAHVLTVDTSSGQVFYTPFEISSSGGGNVIGNPLKPLKLDGSTATVQSTGVIDAKATQTNFKNTSGTTLASIDHTTGDAHFGLSSVDIKGSGEISSSKQLITSDGPDVEDLLMILSPPSANFDDTGSAAVNVNLSGSISASNAYALKLTSPDNNTFGIKADGEVIPSKVTMTALTLTGSGGFGYVKFGNNQDQFIAGSDDQIIIDGDNTIRLQASTGISLAVPSIGNGAIPGGTSTVLTGSITLANGSAYSGSITTEGYISASAFAGDGSSLTNLPSSSPFPFTGSAIISGSTELVGPLNLTGSLIISGSTSPLISLPSVPTDAIIISGSNDRTRLHIYESVLNSSPIYTEGAGIKLVGGTAVGNQATLELSAVGSSNAGSNNEQTFIHSNQQLVIQAADDDAGKNIQFRGSSYGLDLTAATAGVTLAFLTNGGGTVSELNMGNGTYIQADANGTYYKIGRSSTDWLNLSSTKATFAADVSSSSATSTASFGTYLGDGSQLTNTDPFPYTGDAIISGSTTITGSLNVFGGIRQTSGVGANVVLIGNSATLGTTANAEGAVAIGDGAFADMKGIGIGEIARAGLDSITIGAGAGSGTSTGRGSIAIGINAQPTATAISSITLVANDQNEGTTTVSEPRTFGVYLENSTNDAPDLKFMVGPASASYWSGSGYFGLNTKTPTSALDVLGDVKVTGSVSTENVITTTLTASGEISASDIYATNLYGADAVYHKDDANTGIVFSSDTIKLRTNNVESIHLSTTSNLFGNDQDPTIISGSSLTVDTSNTTITGSLNVTGSIEMALPSGSGASYQSFGVPGYFKTRFGQNDSDFEIYRDNFITLQFNNAGSDQIEGSILTDPSAGEIHVTVNNEGAYTYLDKQVSDGIFDIDGSFGNDEISVIYMRSPQDDSWPFYKITVISANATSGASITFLLEKFI